MTLKPSDVESLLHSLEREAAERRYRRRLEENRLEPRGDEPAHLLKHDEQGVPYIERSIEKKLDHDLCNLLEMRNFAESVFERRLDSIDRKYGHLRRKPPGDADRKPLDDALCQAVNERMQAIRSFEDGLERAERAYQERMKLFGDPLPQQHKPDRPRRCPASQARQRQARSGD